MELFKITPTYDVELNKEWMLLIPEFKTLIHADKGSQGDHDGRKKLKARKQFGYIYFVVDFKSPIESWEFSKKHDEALRYTGLDEKDVSNASVRKALEKYEELQLEAARALRSLKSARKALDAIDEYYENINFQEKDKQGKLLHNPKEVASSVAGLNKMYDELEKFERRVYEQLKESTTIRGQASLGDKEHKQTGRTEGAWKETGDSTQEVETPAFDDISTVINRSKKTKLELEVEEDLEDND